MIFISENNQEDRANCQRQVAKFMGERRGWNVSVVSSKCVNRSLVAIVWSFVTSPFHKTCIAPSQERENLIF